MLEYAALHGVHVSARRCPCMLSKPSKLQNAQMLQMLPSKGALGLLHAPSLPLLYTAAP